MRIGRFKFAPPTEKLAVLNEIEEPLKLGYEEFTSILSDWVVIRFSVPCHAWNKLRESKEWKAFQVLMEKYQTEHVQKQHLVGECPQGVEGYK